VRFDRNTLLDRELRDLGDAAVNKKLDAIFANRPRLPTGRESENAPCSSSGL